MLLPVLRSLQSVLCKTVPATDQITHMSVSLLAQLSSALDKNIFQNMEDTSQQNYDLSTVKGINKWQQALEKMA